MVAGTGSSAAGAACVFGMVSEPGVGIVDGPFAWLAVPEGKVAGFWAPCAESETEAFILASAAFFWAIYA